MHGNNVCQILFRCSIHPFSNEDVFSGEYRDKDDDSGDDDDSEDSNDENHWKNDYPDEDSDCIGTLNAHSSLHFC